MQKMILAGGLVILAACATNSPTKSERIATLLEDVRVGEQTDRICFQSTIDSFRDNRRDSVILRRGVNDDYLVLMSGCPRLDEAQSIALLSRGSCLQRADRLLVSDSVFSLSGTGRTGTERCFVDEIYEWNEDVAVGAQPEEEMTEK